MKASRLLLTALSGPLFAACTTQLTSDLPVRTELSRIEQTSPQAPGNGSAYWAVCSGADCPQPTQKRVSSGPVQRVTAGPNDFVQKIPAAPNVEAPAVPEKTRGAQVPTGQPLVVLFDFDSAEIARTNMEPLKQFANDQRGKNGQIAITARTDPRGVLRHNEKLAQRRANAVKKALAELGIPSQRLLVSVAAPCCDGNPGAPEEVQKQLRRAVVTVTAANQQKTEER